MRCQQSLSLFGGVCLARLLHSTTTHGFAFLVNCKHEARGMPSPPHAVADKRRKWLGTNDAR